MNPAMLQTRMLPTSNSLVLAFPSHLEVHSMPHISFPRCYMNRPFILLTTLLLSLSALAATPAPAPSTAPAPKGGYLFTTFKGESTPKTEQIYFGLSPDGLHWDALNN